MTATEREESALQDKGNQPSPSEFDMCTGCPTAFEHLEGTLTNTPTGTVFHEACVQYFYMALQAQLSTRLVLWKTH